MFKIFFLLLSCFNLTHANYEEQKLRNYLYSSYNKQVRPVTNYSNYVDVKMGLAVQNLELFNQKQEIIALNIWKRTTWKDVNLKWNNSISNLTFLSTTSQETWVPDIELLNAASEPEIYTFNGGMNLYNDGTILWSNPAIFKFSCSLNLKYFPFDTQKCMMDFSSWIYNNNLLHLSPYDEKEKQIDILESFSHSEWQITNMNVENINKTRACCGNNTFSNNLYTIILKRYPHYYKLSMGMTISLVIVSFIIMLIKPENVSRTSTAVFIPLTILALQLTIVDKIPVVGYYTLMDYFFLTCFITSMMVSIESGIIFSLVSTKSPYIYKLLYNFFDFNKLIKKDSKSKNKHNNKLLRHSRYLQNIQNHNNGNNGNNGNNDNNDNNGKSDNSHDEALALEEFTNIENALQNRSQSYNDSVKIENKKDENNNINMIINTNSENTENSINSDDTSSINSTIDNNIIKTIDYDDISLQLSYKEKLLFDKFHKNIKFIDNIFRVLFPFIFLIIISIIMDYENKENI